MSISRIELQGQIARAQDYTTIRHNENNKGIVDQNNFQTQFNKVVDERTTQVHHGENTENQNKRFDAKDKGNGQYSGDGGQNRKKDEGKNKDSDGKVFIKNMSRFDMKI
ncbi:hypothetical protein [Kineothrix sp. MB12-C1]|uniref:hypothetical protein n=1 Tax=Kineothrix sp. MB12-C1 TaxID=3070215 RepID=UPI0027D2FA7D|nr:hypothetical protein [Kineothrix sp. MB12-C1]WMC92989.1 hypothetical protein RBB56_01495 [Kineothrix sp. MB12-C1]